MRNPDWLCPICALVRLSYGQSCSTWETTCSNRAAAHLTGQWYITGQEADTNPTVSGVGISEISDEKEDGA